MSQVPATATNTERPSTPSYLLEHLIPGGIWMVLLLANATNLVRYLQEAGSGTVTMSIGLHVVQQLLRIAFNGLIVTLFLTRRSVIGPRAPWLSRIVALVGTFVLVAPSAYQVGDDQPVLLVVSSVLILLGLLLSIVSLRTLDRFFGVFPEARGLVTSGPYRYVRHPLYLGEIITGLGLVVGTAWPPLVGLFVVLCVCQIWRTYLEERVLTNAIPGYASYRQHTRRIIPFIY